MDSLNDQSLDAFDFYWVMFGRKCQNKYVLKINWVCIERLKKQFQHVLKFFLLCNARFDVFLIKRLKIKFYTIDIKVSLVLARIIRELSKFCVSQIG
ncbi:hypothetical protein DSM16313_19380 [Acinetobacter seohaensis]|nr:hypothetical protein DSM16313_19380 [Acinetobacter seohaensis]